MARRKRQNPLLIVAQTYLKQHTPDLAGAPLKLRTLDGPPDAPRYVVTAETCNVGECPYGVAPERVACGECPVLACPLRHSVRLLFSRRGEMLHTTDSDIHWA